MGLSQRAPCSEEICLQRNFAKIKKQLPIIFLKISRHTKEFAKCRHRDQL